MLVRVRVGPLWGRDGIWVTVSGPSLPWMTTLAAELLNLRDGAEVDPEAGEYMWGQTLQVGWQFEDMAFAVPIFRDAVAMLIRDHIHVDTVEAQVDLDA